VTRTKTALIAALLCAISGCGYAPLEPRPDEPEQRDDLPGPGARQEPGRQALGRGAVGLDEQRRHAYR